MKIIFILLTGFLFSCSTEKSKNTSINNSHDLTIKKIEEAIQFYLTEKYYTTLSIGIILPDSTLLINRGGAKNNSIYEIGSITKTFLGLSLAQLRLENTLNVNDKVSKYLSGSVSESVGEKQLKDLIRHTSMLPNEPDNLKVDDPKNWWSRYSDQLLLEFLKNYHSSETINEFKGANYSNLAAGLLG